MIVKQTESLKSPVLVAQALLGERSTWASALLHPLHHLSLQSQAALRLRVRQRGHPLGLVSRQLGLLNATQDKEVIESAMMFITSLKDELSLILLTTWTSCSRLYLLQQLNFGLQDFLHVADLLLPTLQATLQLGFALIGQALCCWPVWWKNMKTRWWWPQNRWLAIKIWVIVSPQMFSVCCSQKMSPASRLTLAIFSSKCNVSEGSLLWPSICSK